jgi:hypothetical protein
VMALLRTAWSCSSAILALTLPDLATRMRACRVHAVSASPLQRTWSQKGRSLNGKDDGGA